MSLNNNMSQTLNNLCLLFIVCLMMTKDINQNIIFIPTAMSHSNYLDFDQDQQRLPLNFAEDMLDLELKIDTDEYSMMVMQRLNQLYRIGVEYYVVNEPKKSAYFQKKLASLLSHPQTLILIDPRAKISRESLVRENMRQELQKVSSQADLCIKNMMKNAEKRISQGQNLIKQSLTSQQDKFQLRLERVKSKKILK